MKFRTSINKRRSLFFTLVLTLYLLFFTQEMTPQVVQGTMVDENGDGLAEVNLELYINPFVYTTTSQSDGSFTFTNVSGVEDEQLPTGYYVSNNFPNPFNPTTRIILTLPNGGNVRVAVFNVLGETVTEQIENYFNAGTNNIDLELNGLSNGFYFAKISIDDRYTVVKKMMLLYGSQHLSMGGGLLKYSHKKNNDSERSLLVTIDSLVATSSIIGRKTFTNLPPFSGGMLTLSPITIVRYCFGIPTVNYGGKTYHTVQIGNQCWFKENLDLGTRIDGVVYQADNLVLEKYCYQNDPANCGIYGGLYQWGEAMQYVTTEKAQGICPPGWHIPTQNDIDTLSETVGDNGNLLKAEGEGSGDGSGNNVSGFSALLAGHRYYAGGYFAYLGQAGSFWSSTEFTNIYSRSGQLYDYNNSFIVGSNNKDYGYSVRCLKD